MMFVTYRYRPLVGHAPKFCESLDHIRTNTLASEIVLIFERESGAVRESFYVCGDCSAVLTTHPSSYDVTIVDKDEEKDVA